MKGKNSEAAPGVETFREVTQERIESGELVVDCNPQRLKNPPHRKLPFFFLQPRQAVANGFSQFACRRQRPTGKTEASVGLDSSLLARRRRASLSADSFCRSSRAGAPRSGFIRK